MLVDDWDEDRLKRLVRELRRLLSPTASEEQFKILLNLSAFTGETTGFSGLALLEESVQADIFKDPPKDGYLQLSPFALGAIGDYELSGAFDASGAFSGTFKIARGDGATTSVTLPAPSNRPLCGPFKVSFNIYDGEHESIVDLFSRAKIPSDRLGIREMRRMLAEQSGLAIYRNGFRLRPYGDPGYDWLELERRRVQDPSYRIGTTQLSGKVEVGDESTSGLVERSSREGLENSESLDDLKAQLLRLLEDVQQRRVAFRERAGLSRRPKAGLGELRQLASLAEVRRVLSSLPQATQAPLVAAVDLESASINRELDRLTDYHRLLESRAAMGLVFAEYLHESRTFLSTITNMTDLATDDLAQANIPNAGKLSQRLGSIHEASVSLAKLLKRLDPISGRRRGKRQAVNVAKVIASSLEHMNQKIMAASIGLTVDVESDGLEFAGYFEDLQTGLMNVLDNAVHWLSSTAMSNRRIAVRAWSVGKSAYVSVTNNGPEIPESIRDRIFDPGVSLKTDGQGLGLAISREAIRASDGELLLLSDQSDVTFAFVVPLVVTSAQLGGLG